MYQNMSIPTYGVLKRAGPLCVLLIQILAALSAKRSQVRVFPKNNFSFRLLSTQAIQERFVLEFIKHVLEFGTLHNGFVLFSRISSSCVCVCLCVGVCVCAHVCDHVSVSASVSAFVSASTSASVSVSMCMRETHDGHN